MTRRSRERLWVNADRIESLEATPDTIVTLVGGEKIIVLDSLDELLRQIDEQQTRRGRESRLRLAAAPLPESEAR